MSDPSAEPRVWLVVPCYNESERLRPAAFLDFVRAHADVRLLFVDDGSTDATPDLLQELAAAGAGSIEVLTLPSNGGKAVAVHAGVLHALARQTEFVGYWDCDLATPLDALADFLAAFEARPATEIVLGSRIMLLGRSITRHAWRHYLGRVFATGASVAVGLSVYDTQCGAKLFRGTRAVRRAFEAPFQSAWVFDVEFLARYVVEVGRAAAAERIVELPLHEWTDVPGSKVKAWHGLRAAWDLWRIWRARRSGGTR